LNNILWGIVGKAKTVTKMQVSSGYLAKKKSIETPKLFYHRSMMVAFIPVPGVEPGAVRSNHTVD
jgi:hypothetical protein